MVHSRREHGLSINYSKSTVICPQSKPESFKQARILLEKYGIEIRDKFNVKYLNVFFGDEAFINSESDNKVQELEEAVNRILRIKDIHCRITALRVCGAHCKTEYLTNCMPPHQVQYLLTKFEKILCQAMDRTLETAGKLTTSSVEWRRMGLAKHMSGSSIGSGLSVSGANYATSVCKARVEVERLLGSEFNAVRTAEVGAGEWLRERIGAIDTEALFRQIQPFRNRLDITTPDQTLTHTERARRKCANDRLSDPMYELDRLQRRIRATEAKVSLRQRCQLALWRELHGELATDRDAQV